MGKVTSGDELDGMWVNFDDRVAEICHRYRTTRKAMGEKCGFNPAQLSQFKGKGKHSIAFRIMLGYPEISARWLLFGQGEMVEKAKHDTAPATNEPMPEGIKAIITNDNVYKYMYEEKKAEYDAKVREVQSITAHYVETITNLQRDIEVLKKENEQLRAHPRPYALPYEDTFTEYAHVAEDVK